MAEEAAQEGGNLKPTLDLKTMKILKEKQLGAANIPLDYLTDDLIKYVVFLILLNSSFLHLFFFVFAV